MKHRRLLALLTSAAMLHLSVVAGDAACATHGAGGHHAAEATVASPMSMHDHEMATVDRASGSVSSVIPVARFGAPPCEIPTQPQCCEAMVGCNMDSAAVEGPQMLRAAVVPAMQLWVAADDLHASFAPAPEPPPPKA